MKFDANWDTLQENLCKAVVDTKLYSKLYAHKFISQVVSYNFVFQELLPKLNSSDTSKFRFYSTHQETLGPLVKDLGFEMFQRTEPGSSLFIELTPTKDVIIRYMRDGDTEKF